MRATCTMLNAYTVLLTLHKAPFGQSPSFRSPCPCTAGREARGLFLNLNLCLHACRYTKCSEAAHIQRDLTELQEEVDAYELQRWLFYILPGACTAHSD